MCESVLMRRTKAKNVENPPFQTAGPMRVKVTLARAKRRKKAINKIK